MNPIDILYHQGRLREIDVHFGRFIHDLAGQGGPDLALAAALVCHATAEGSICLDLKGLAGKILVEDADGKDGPACPELAVWEEKLRAVPVVGEPGRYAPLILDERRRLYLYRYWRYESDLAADILRRAGATQPLETLNVDVLRDGLHRLFPPPSDPQEIDRQKIAAVVAVLKRFCVITGGPGTGKTAVIAKILTLLLEQAHRSRLKIFLAAPTGKAAAKLGASLRSVRQTLNCSAAVREAIPTDAQTLHRLLRPIPDRSDFFYHSENPLPADVVVVDEASMVDLALMAKLVRALSADTRLILLGDKDQLASVEAGAVLGDICAANDAAGFSPAMIGHLEHVTHERLSGAFTGDRSTGAVQDCIVPLMKSYRFPAGSGIDALRLAVNAGNVDQVFRLLEESGDGSVKHQSVDAPTRLTELLPKRLAEGYPSPAACKDPARALEQLERERLLCVLREGPWGVQTLNRWAETNAYPRRRTGVEPQWYPGRPVLITSNDYRLGLFNGDIGITLGETDVDEVRLSVFFPAQSGEIRKIPVHRIADHETAWAMTVHKSQGSEFDHIHLILPDIDTPLLSRELIYTAVTRARSSATIYGRRHILAAAIRRQTRRGSGLREALWGAS